ncbi:hypothetical protein HDU92_008920 [Lobulomyces angularis]|nr:hypothetical protein HDU92_008920 [Lobulomyces angularis]
MSKKLTDEELHFQSLIRDLVSTDQSNQPKQFSISSEDQTSKPQIALQQDKENFDQISYTIKQIFQQGNQDKFTKVLQNFVSKKESEIERLCSINYQEFVTAIDQLLKVRLETVSLKEKILLLNGKMSESGSTIILRKKEIIQYKKILSNAETGLDAIKTCLHVIDISNKINVHIENKKYYHALRMLDDLQSTHLKNIIQYSFAQHLQSCVGVLKENIKEAVLTEMKGWYVKVREISRKAGNLAMRNTKARQEKVQAQREEQKQQNGEIFKTTVNVTTQVELQMMEDPNLEDCLNNNLIKLDFRPLYQCLHIYFVLGKFDELKSSYEENRQLQFDLIFSNSFTFQNGTVEEFQQFLHDIIGFFIIEAVVVNTTQDFRPTTRVESLWDTTINNINVLITENLKKCDNPALFLNIKLSVILFMQTLEGHGYTVSKLSDLMISLFDRYADLLKSEFETKICNIIEEDEYAPMLINSAEELQIVLDMFKIVDPEILNAKKFPITLPFSKGVPIICKLIKNFIKGFYRFAEGFQQQNNEMDDLLKKSLENMISVSLNGALIELLYHNNLSQAVQILINVMTFEKSLHQFEKILTENRSTHSGTMVSLISSANSFKNVKGLTEKRIFEVINVKIDEFLELAEYDWLASKVTKESSAYLNDLVDYISTVIASSLSNLPTELRTYIYFGALNHLASSLHKNLDQTLKVYLLGTALQN